MQVGEKNEEAPYGECPGEHPLSTGEKYDGSSSRGDQTVDKSIALPDKHILL
jgi:hypothetical protein